MIKVLFVCLGNICRSPMAEYVFKDWLKKENLSDKIQVSSAGTSSEEAGNGMHYGTKRKLDEICIEYGNHKARQITKKDYKEYDYIIVMEESNIEEVKRIVGEDTENKIHRFLDYSNNPRDIADPWYTGNFNKTYDDILEGSQYFLEYLKSKIS